MTPEQLEKLAAAREKAKAVKDAMKSENDDHKIRILQAKMDAIKKTSKKKPDPPEQMTDLEEEPLVPEPDRTPEPEAEPKEMTSVPEEIPDMRMPEPEPEPEPVTKPVKQKPKKGKKPVVIVDESGSDSSDDDDNSNVIYIRRKKKKSNAPPPPHTHRRHAQAVADRGQRVALDQRRHADRLRAQVRVARRPVRDHRRRGEASRRAAANHGRLRSHLRQRRARAAGEAVLLHEPAGQLPRSSPRV